MSAAPELSVTHTGRVTADQIDDLGHMNVRWYGHRARAGTAELCARLSLGAPATISAYTRHHHEQMQGSELEVRSAIVGGGSRLRFYHELRNAADDDLAATFVHELDHPPIEAPAIELPEHGRPRSLDLDIDRLAATPSLDELRDRGIAIRLERTVTADDVHPNDLVWGGERPHGDESWIHVAADGDRIASATMESRFWLRDFPPVGTRIQPFVANVHVGDKITHELGWVFDLDRGRVVAVYEGVDLAFSITQRRSVVMPPERRARELEMYHPDLAERAAG